MTVVFARGTTEPGNVGLLAGPEFFDALTDMLGAKNVDVVGVEYGATIEGFLQGGDKQGSALMASLVSSTLKSCPNTKLVMSGYSQGGQLVHNAAALLPSSTMAQVSSVVIFGDPLNGKPVVGASAGKTLIVCHKGDNICDGGDLILLEHLTYSQNAQQAATFAAARAGMGLGN
ncbi:cutA, cutinase A [Tricladium varicosporioides]|nr:cutA, cutinase A [Hymenoscyphus varicosporioides]